MSFKNIIERIKIINKILPTDDKLETEVDKHFAKKIRGKKINIKDK